MTKPNHTYHGDQALILDWIFYHDVMYKFSIRHWRDKNPDQIALAGQKKVISKPASSDRQMVCSLMNMIFSDNRLESTVHLTDSTYRLYDSLAAR